MKSTTLKRSDLNEMASKARRGLKKRLNPGDFVLAEWELRIHDRGASLVVRSYNGEEYPVAL